MKSVKDRWAGLRRRRRAAAEDRERRRQVKRHHRAVLEKAAGISSLAVVCHEDTWWIVEQIAFSPFFYTRFPHDRIKRGAAGMVTVTVSGPHLVRCLDKLLQWWPAKGLFLAHQPDAAVARHLYTKMAALVDGIDPRSCCGGIPPLIVDVGLETGEAVTT
ncbi:hypothetical protein OIE69_44615 (plasmid) [Actinacidiphila glaucinigra]|uniref:hypothetical protein n=1 Tax=Actinacidiphila glaucinigra TaxID=235986 RepID=UPI002DDAE5C4|nr:hypothetical protein [Actinacidiphila glaucinigra]WSD65724.1 hypothetical protein OIE69_43235 [Actinacidiphila glaucinigra]WSD65988.1 hypothetical protein OIE69_44615 [Actinacidiphila glaucinigra]